MAGYYSDIDPVTPEAIAIDALQHLLVRIRNGHCTWCGDESFDRLTHAYSALSGQPVEEVRALFRPTDPASGAR